MKWRGRRQSKNVHVQTYKEAEAASYKYAQYNRAKSSGRALSPEPIESNNDKTVIEERTASLRNPGRHTRATKRPVDNSSKGNKFFKHTEKDF